MIGIVQFIFMVILISVVLIAPGLILEYWFVKMGYVRDNKWMIIVLTISLVVIKQLWFKDISWWVWGIATVLGIILGGNRGDLGETIKSGAWWWKSEKKRKRKNQPEGD